MSPKRSRNARCVRTPAPAMEGAPQALLDDRALGQIGPQVRAGSLHDAEPTGQFPVQHEVGVADPDSSHRSGCHTPGQADWIPPLAYDGWIRESKERRFR